MATLPSLPLVIEHLADHVRCLLDLRTRHIKMRDKAHTRLIHRVDQHITLAQGPLQSRSVEGRLGGVELQEEDVGFHLLRIET